MVNVFVVMYFLLWCIFFSCTEFFISMRACILFFFHVPSVLFLCSMFFKWKSL
jgi:hypothetical protein